MAETAEDVLARARDAFRARRWRDAHDLYAQADVSGALDPADRVDLATSAFLLGRDDERDAHLERAHDAWVERGEPIRAATAAFWLGMGLLDRGEEARGSGWLGRARRLVPDDHDGVEQAYLRIPGGLRALYGGDAAEALEIFRAGHEVASRFDDVDARALTQLGVGQATILSGQVADGLALLDEVMLSVEAGAVSPQPAGIIYCAVISVCHLVSDLRRAHAWTDALSAWCERQPDLVPFRGQCLVHRAELMALHGAWDDALREADRACERLADPPGQSAIGDAHYQRAELLRLQGRYDAAEADYREANRHGRTPQPGLAQLRAARGELGTAAASMDRVLSEPAPPAARARQLAVAAEVALADDDVVAARAAADELDEVAGALDAPMLDAMADHVGGAVLVAEGDARGALARLRRAAEGWRGVDAPYESARVRVLIGLACRELGDRDGAELELDAAAEVFTALGAGPDLARLDQLRGRGGRGARARDDGGLSPRELEVLRLVAAGRSNRAIAEELVISEHTVARHVQNIFVKLDVGSRTAAAAWAFEHDRA